MAIVSHDDRLLRISRIIHTHAHFGLIKEPGRSSEFQFNLGNKESKKPDAPVVVDGQRLIGNPRNKCDTCSRRCEENG